MIYYLSEADKENFNYNAGYKARSDVEKIISSQKGIDGPLYFSNIIHRNPNESKRQKLLAHLKSFWVWKKLAKRFKPGDTIVIQYPIVNRYFALEKLLISKAKAGVKFIFLVHDLEFIRYSKESRKTALNLELLNAANKVILHNQKMIDYAVQAGLRAPTISLNAFDYLCPEPNREIDINKSFASKVVAFAGNLTREKAGFLYELPSSPTFRVYGKGLDKTLKRENIEYAGFFNPNEPDIEASFGLVWDGPSATNCEGSYGEYERINHPHKASLYLASGLPLLAWEEAAIADLVKQFGCGVTIKSLLDLNEILSSLSLEQYQNMVKAAQQLGAKIRQGQFTKEAIDQTLAD